MVETLGRYEILEEIGRGGFAVVYRARDTQLNRLVALKELRPALLHDADWIKRFYREARIVASLDHPHIVTIYDVAEAEKRLFITMRLVDGPSLEKLIATQGRLSWSRTAEIIGVIADGLDFAHSQGILHRDLKPANILLDPDRGPMLSDFGLAKLISESGLSITAAGGVVGTPHYIAPEVWEGQGTTARSDIYALGCILYEMLTGDKVFQGETPPTVMMSHFSPLALPAAWPEGVPAGVTDVLETALAKQPADRYEAAGEMAGALAGLAKTPFVLPAAPLDRRTSPSILMTKLYRPPAHPELVYRPRLTRRLTDALRLQHKLVLISAPAGFGKTTLASAWLSEVDESASTWLSLDEKDNNPARFLTYFIAAVQQVDSGFGRTTQNILQTSPSPAVEPIMTSLINEITTFNTSFVFVLDDYHVITQRAIHSAINFLLDHIPPQMRLIITSRADLPFSLSRLRVRRQVTEIRASDLRFTKTEAAAFLNQTMNLNLSIEAIAALETRTEGWIAGLQLAALSMGNLEEAHKDDFVAALAGDDRYILDYLIEEVLDRQPMHIQTFLLQTSILERLSGPLCDAVLGDERIAELANDESLAGTSSFAHSPFTHLSSQKILEHLERHNLFVVPLDNKRQWYRYHHLFADLLHNQLEASQPKLEHSLHRRASAWYEQNDLMSEAIVHSLAARDVEQAARLVEQTFTDMMSRDEYFTTMLERLEALPEEIIRARPWLGIMHAWMLSITLQIDAVEPRLQEVEKSTGGQLPADLRLQIDHIRAEVARQRLEVDRAIELSHRVLAALPENPSGANRQTLAGTLFNLAFAYLMKGDVMDAQQWVSEALALSQAVGSITLTLLAMSVQAKVQLSQGQLHRAAETYRQALQKADTVAQQSGEGVPAAAYILPGLGELLREWNELAEAAHHLKRGLELSQQWQIEEMVRDCYLLQARLDQAEGDIPGALNALRQAEQLPVCQGVSAYGNAVAAGRARLMLAHVVSSGSSSDPGSLKAVEQWAEARNLGADALTNLMDDEYEVLVWIRLRIIQNEPDQVLPLLDRLLRAAEDSGRIERMIEILNLKALAQQALGNVDQALNALEQALSLAKPEGYIRLFVDEGRPMVKLLQQVARRGIAQDYVAKLVAACEAGGVVAASPPRSPTLPAPPLVEPLSDRELDVLRLLNTDLSGPEIAAELVVSVNTVKTHIKNIYSKLNVHGRYEAVERAKELQLL